VNEYNAYELARMAGCASPDTLNSAGAHFLALVADSAAEDVERLRDSDERNDAAHDIADACVPVYTVDVWRTFVDLAAWTEDPSELGADVSDMEQAAKVCLYLIAERLVYALADELAEDEDDESDEVDA